MRPSFLWLLPFFLATFMPTHHLTVSIGACTFPVDVQNSQEIIENADKHLYSAKRLGRDRICFSSEVKEVENR